MSTHLNQKEYEFYTALTRDPIFGNVNAAVLDLEARGKLSGILSLTAPDGYYLIPSSYYPPQPDTHYSLRLDLLNNIKTQPIIAYAQELAESRGLCVEVIRPFSNALGRIDFIPLTPDLLEEFDIDILRQRNDIDFPRSFFKQVRFQGCKMS